MTLTDNFNVRIIKTTSKQKKRAKNPNKSRKTRGDGFVFAISGAHGVGKTTIYQMLTKYFEDEPNIKFFPERYRAVPPVPFGSKDKQTAFRSEIHYTQQMLKRNEMIKKFVINHRENIAILDRTYLSTIVYSRALILPKIDLELIEDTVNSVDWTKEYIIYLEAQPKTIMKRIQKRGSLDSTRLKWNEEDFQYLLTVIKKYNEIFKEKSLSKSNRLIRISTDDKTPEQVLNKILEIISSKSGLILNKVKKIPKEQAKITQWAYL